MSTVTVKAYEVRDSVEGNCCIVFATNGAAARRKCANELNTDWECVESCRRAPWADEYTPGPVPLSALVAAGWWHECSHCGCTFDSDGRQDSKKRDDACDPVHAHGMNFCSPTCSMQEWAERRVQESCRNAVIEACAINWPSATSITVHEYPKARGNEVEWHANFILPGLQHSIEWTLGNKEVMVSQCDVEAFNAWKAFTA